MRIGQPCCEILHGNVSDETYIHLLNGVKRKHSTNPARNPLRRDEQEARALVTAVEDELRGVREERDMHRQKAESLETALEAVLQECSKAEAATPRMGGSQAGCGMDSPRGVEPAIATGAEEQAPGLAERVPVPAEADENAAPFSESSLDSNPNPNANANPVVELRTESDPCSHAAGQTERSDAVGEDGVTKTDSASTPSLLLDACSEDDGSDGRERSEVHLLPFDGDSGGDRSSQGGDVEAADPKVTCSSSVTTGPECLQNGSSPSGVDKDLLDVKDEGGGDGGLEDAAVCNTAADNTHGDGIPENGRGGNLLHLHDEDGNYAGSEPDVENSVGDAGRDNDGGDGQRGGYDHEGDDGGAAAQETLVTWLADLKIRRPDAVHYAESLVADGFDSREVGP